MNTKKNNGWPYLLIISPDLQISERISVLFVAAGFTRNQKNTSDITVIHWYKYRFNPAFQFHIIPDTISQ